MNNAGNKSNFYFYMAITLSVLIIAGFGSAMIVLNRSPADMPLIFHIHGITYLAWYTLLIIQTRLISNLNYTLHRSLGYGSLIIFIGMLITAFLVMSHSYDRGTSPIPIFTIEQFMFFPLMDAVGLVLFYLMAVFNTDKPMVHKHSMIICSIAIMDPALARLGMALEFPPLTLMLHVGLVISVMVHDWRGSKQIHFVTWMGLAYVILRPTLTFTLAATEGWAELVQNIFD